MISLTEYIRRLKNLRELYLRDRIQLFLSAADDATALMKIRVINKRLNDQGQVFGIYADSTIKRKGTRNSSSGDKRINFSDTNRMWSGTGVSGRGVRARLILSTDDKITIQIQPENDDDRIEVLGYLERPKAEGGFGPIVAWNKEEQKLLVTIFQNRLADLVRKSGL